LITRYKVDWNIKKNQASSKISLIRELRSLQQNAESAVGKI